MGNNSETVENNNSAVDAKIEQAYLSLLKETLSAARLNWEKPWLRSVVNFNPQGFDGHLYTGSNHFFLSLMDHFMGYTTPIHITFPRAISEGISINKGEHGDPAIKYNIYYLPDDEGRKMGMKYASEEDYSKMPDEIKEHYYAVGKYIGFTVFNLDQTNIREANPELFQKMLDRFTQKNGERDNTRRMAIRALDDTIRQNTWICPIKEDSVGSAYWQSVNNYIRVPSIMDFKDDVSFYRTLIHEMIHSTSVLPKRELSPYEKKLLESEDCPKEKRDQIEQKRNERLRTYDYSLLHDRAREEMVADLGAAMVMTQIGIDATFSPQNQAYLQTWYSRIGLKEGTGEVFNPQFDKFGSLLKEAGWQGNFKRLLSDTASVGKGNSLDQVIQAHHVPALEILLLLLEKVRDGEIPLKVKGTTLIPMTEEEKREAGVEKNVLTNIVKDAWKAAKIVMQDGLKMDLKKDIKQGEDFSAINDRKRETAKSKSEAYHKKPARSSSNSYKSSNSYSRKKNGR